MTLFINPEVPDLYEKIRRLNPTPGFCFFIDIVSSTEMKDEELHKWIAYIYNVFTNIQTFLYMKFRPMKSIGDCLMFFIPESDMRDETPLTLFDGLYKIITSNESYLKEVKIGAVYCRNVYNISFIEGNIDYYGKDIDLATRLLSKANSKEIVFNDEFFNRIRSEYDSISNKDNFPYIMTILGPFLERIRGFRKNILFYRLSA